MIRVISVCVLLFSILPVRAETTLSAAAGAKCARKSLQKITEKYVDALKKGKPSRMPLAKQAKYIENRSEIPFGQGIWKEPLVVDFSRSLLDVEKWWALTVANFTGPIL